MNRRRFVAGLGGSGLAMAAVSAAASTAAKGREIIDQSAAGVNKRVEALKIRMDVLEAGQKKYLKALCVITAVSTGIDLSILI
jgi:hypothetical protein